MSLFRLIIASLLYHRRTNLAVALGVAAGTAVLTGALLVGDSMRGSLRHLVLDRLGKIDRLLITDKFFRQELADEIDGVPAIMIRVSLDNTAQDPPTRANAVQLVGCDERFWKLGETLPTERLSGRKIVLNEPLAEQLGAKIGDRLMVRLPQQGPIPAETTLGKTTDTVKGFALTVADIIPAESLGRFSLRPTQQLPRNAYVPLDWLQARLEQEGRVNAILATEDSAPDEELRPRFEDYGLSMQKTDRGYFNFTSERMLLEPAAEEEILESLADEETQPVLTYLANTIACGEKKIPYSTVTAINFTAEPPLGPFVSTDGKPVEPLKYGQVALNTWAAKELDAKPGDTIRLTFFDPESTHGEATESTMELKLVAVVKLEGAAADRDLTPKVPGVTDELSMADWDPPFPFDATRIRSEDETYWDDHGPTPKAFVSLSLGQQIWGSRFGQVTSIRVRPKEGMTVESLEKQIEIDPASMGFLLQPIKLQGLKSAAGTTPFNVLFLAFSFFLIASAVMLVSLLFRLGIDQRAEQIGILTAVGLRPRQIVRVLSAEGLIVSALGSLLGVGLGVGYAALMLLGLRTWWLAAVVTPFLRLYVTPTSLVVGWLSGMIIAYATIRWSLRQIAKTSPRQLLSGHAGNEQTQLVHGRPLPRYLRPVELLIVLLIHLGVLGLWTLQLSEIARAGTFFGVGALVLVLLMVRVWLGLRARVSKAAVRVGRGNIWRMAVSNAARNPGRSTLTVGLIASATFLIVAIGAFHLDPSGATPELESGNGGFALYAESDRPIYQDVNTAAGRDELGFSEEDSQLLAKCKTISLRAKTGDDASCLNLYRAVRPRLLGVPQEMIDRGGFTWAASMGSEDNPWKLLDGPPETKFDGTPVLPVVLEKNTANYALNLWDGVGQEFEIEDDHGRTIQLRVVGLLGGSIFQGDLLVSERSLLRCFPEVAGRRVLLVETPPEDTAQVQAALERTLGDYGLAAETTGRRLAGFLTVQNTYLSTFSSLGGLGLLLGTIGLAAVQLRNVFERRGELALLRAVGIGRGRLAWLVFLENLVLLSAGLICGIAAAVVAVLPHILERSAEIPWATLAVTLAAVFVAGVVASLAAVRAALAAPLLRTLREEA